MVLTVWAEPQGPCQSPQLGVHPESLRGLVPSVVAALDPSAAPVSAPNTTQCKPTHRRSTFPFISAAFALPPPWDPSLEGVPQRTVFSKGILTPGMGVGDQSLPASALTAALGQKKDLTCPLQSLSPLSPSQSPGPMGLKLPSINSPLSPVGNQSCGAMHLTPNGYVVGCCCISYFSENKSKNC